MHERKALAVAGGKSLLVEEVFSPYLYEGNSSAQTITNGIDLAGEGGLVWIKVRTGAFNNYLFDTERGAENRIVSNDTSSEVNVPTSLTAFNSDGFDLSSHAGFNGAYDYASWTFRKAPRFFDVVTYTGDGVAGREIAHSLGVTPGMMIVKCTSAGTVYPWRVYHKSTTGTSYGQLNETSAFVAASSVWNDINATTTEFTVGANTYVNEDTKSYVAYIFAHDPLGPSGDGRDGMIACGSYTGNGLADGPEIDLGWEPQYILLKNTTGTTSWFVFDVMRGLVVGGSDRYTQPDNPSADSSITAIDITPTGFSITSAASSFNTSAAEYIYMAIRRPMGVPESASEVFAIDEQNGTIKPAFKAGFPIDMALSRNVSSAVNPINASARLAQGGFLQTTDTGIESSNGAYVFDYMNGHFDSAAVSTDYYSWMWKRAPGFFDVVAYTGTSVTTSYDHNLCVAPEMMWVKGRTYTAGTNNWVVYHKDLTNTESLYLNTDAAKSSATGYWNSTTPTDTQFSLIYTNETNRFGEDYVAYLFATLPGISKVGSFTGNGTAQTIDCGFTAGARFVMIKSVTDTGNWLFWDSTRGIVAGDDPHLALNATAAEITTNDSINPDTSGFVVNLDGGAATLDQININLKEYIYYAVA